MKISKQIITGNTVKSIKEQLSWLINQSDPSFDCKKDVAEFFGVNDVHELYSCVEDTLTFRGRKVGGWISTITVIITAYYKDAGSDEYAYLVNVVED